MASLGEVVEYQVLTSLMGYIRPWNPLGATYDYPAWGAYGAPQTTDALAERAEDRKWVLAEAVYIRVTIGYTLGNC